MLASCGGIARVGQHKKSKLMLAQPGVKPNSFLAAWASGAYKSDSRLPDGRAERAISEAMVQSSISATLHAARLETSLDGARGLTPGGPGGAPKPGLYASAKQVVPAADALSARVIELERQLELAERAGYRATRPTVPSPSVRSPLRKQPPTICSSVSGHNEAVAAAAKARQTQKEVQQINEFGGMDADGNGTLSVMELAKKLKLSPREAAAIVATYDVNGDGELSLDEFAEAQRQLGPVVSVGVSGRRSGARAAELARVSAALARNSKEESAAALSEHMRRLEAEATKTTAETASSDRGKDLSVNEQQTGQRSDEAAATAAQDAAVRKAADASDNAQTYWPPFVSHENWPADRQPFASHAASPIVSARGVPSSSPSK